jgi:hypothetical protein
MFREQQRCAVCGRGVHVSAQQLQLRVHCSPLQVRQISTYTPINLPALLHLSNRVKNLFLFMYFFQ